MERILPVNERIKQLALDADIDFGYDWQVIGLADDSLKTYTELIIKEILNITDEVVESYYSPEWIICEKLDINHDWRRQNNFWDE